MKRQLLFLSLILVSLFACDMVDGSNGSPVNPTTPGIDSDNDGLDDFIEVEGFTIVIETSGLDNYVKKVVYSDPTVADTDGDGLLDGQERQFMCNPNHSDTDGDSLSDYDEVKLYKTAPNMIDSDLDSLGNPAFFDGMERSEYGTSPIHADTDGDGYSDRIEVESPIPYKAIIANLPELEFSWSSLPNVTINKVETATTTSSFTETNFTSSSTSSNQHSYQSLNTIESCNIDSSTKANWSARKGARVESTLDINLYKQTNTFSSESFSLSTDFTNENTMQQFLSGSESVTLSGGTMNMTLDIKNKGDREVSLQSIEIGVFLVGDSGRHDDRISICTLYPDSTLPVQLKTNSSSISMNFGNDDLNLENIRKALRSPERLRFEINNYNFEDSTSGGHNYSTIREAVNNNDILVNIDYSYGNGSESFLVAGNVERDTQGNYSGISLQRIMEIIGKEYAVEDEDGINVLTSITKDNQTEITATDANGGIWIVILPRGVQQDGMDFGDIILTPGEGTNYVNMIYTENSDEDVLWDFEDDDIEHNRFFLLTEWSEYLGQIEYSNPASGIPSNVSSFKISMDVRFRSDSHTLGPVPVFKDYSILTSSMDTAANASAKLPNLTPQKYVFWVTDKRGNTFWVDTILSTTTYYKDGTAPRYDNIISSQQWVFDPDNPNPPSVHGQGWSRIIAPETYPGAIGLGKDEYGYHIHQLPGLTTINAIFLGVKAVYYR